MKWKRQKNFVGNLRPPPVKSLRDARLPIDPGTQIKTDSSQTKCSNVILPLKDAESKSGGYSFAPMIFE